MRLIWSLPVAFLLLLPGACKVSDPPSGSFDAEDLAGVWEGDYSPTLIRLVDDELRATYHLLGGTIVGTLDDGVWKGWWCQEPDRRPPDNAGYAEFTVLVDSDGPYALDGRWRNGMDGPTFEDWDMRKTNDPEPDDLAARFERQSDFCQRP